MMTSSCNNNNNNRKSHRYYFHQKGRHWSSSSSVLLLLLLPLLVVAVCFTQSSILHVTAANDGGATTSTVIVDGEFSNGAPVSSSSSSLECLESSSSSSHDDDDRDDDDPLRPQPFADDHGICLSSSSSISNNALLGSYNQLSQNELKDIVAVGGPRAHVYGEMTASGFRQFAAYVNLTNNNNNNGGGGDADDDDDEVFVDLGSGVGRLVIQAVVEFGVGRSIGVELSTARHAAAVQSYQQLKRMMTRDDKDDDQNEDNGVTFVQGNAADKAVVGRFLANATVVWISNLLFDDALNQKLARVIEEYAGPKLRVIASLKPLLVSSPMEGFELLPFKVPFEMSWNTGIHNQFEQQELHHPPPPQQHQQQQSSTTTTPSSSLPGHFCSILLRRRPNVE
jgi:Histone methylation protein DOT1